MFSSVLIGAVSGMTFAQIAMCVSGALACGLLIGILYHHYARVTRAFTTTVILMPLLVMAVIILVNGNLGVGVAVAGSFSLVRFRSVPGKASDIGVIFLTVAAGLACGMGYITFAFMITAIACTAGMIAIHFPFLQPDAQMRYITIQIPEDLNYGSAFQDIFDTYTSSATLQDVRTVRMGMLYELHYTAILKDPAKEQEMINAIRTRNGNLTVRVSLQSDNANEL